VFNFGNLDAPSMVKLGLETSLVNNVKCFKGRLSIVTDVEANFHVVRCSLLYSENNHLVQMDNNIINIL
jgi:hypothetical protein